MTANVLQQKLIALRRLLLLWPRLEGGKVSSFLLIAEKPFT